MTKEKNRRDFLKETFGMLAAVPLAGFLADAQIAAQSQKSEKAEKTENMEKSFFSQTEVYTSGAEGYHTYRIPALVLTKKGTLLAFAEGRKGGASDTGEIDLLLKRSSDGGESWTNQQIVWDDGTNTCGNPCPVVDRKTGRVHLLMTGNLGIDHERDIIAGTSKSTRTVWYAFSDDDGVTWSKAREITDAVKEKNWTWYATGPGAGIQTKKGRLVIPCDHIEKDTKINSSHVIYSDDNGKTWKLGGSANGDTNESEVVELADGNLMLNMRNSIREVKKRAVSISRDGGKTWSAPTRDAELVEPICQASIRRYSVKGKNSKTGNAILFTNPASEKREKMTVRVSTDEGKTWSMKRTINQSRSAYSCLAVAPDKTIYCMYERGENSPYERITLAKFNYAWIAEGNEKQ